MASRAQVEAWKAARAGWRLANRGDNWYSAERRLFNMQMKEQRKQWLLEDLHRRRAAYLKQCAETETKAEAAEQHERNQRETSTQLLGDEFLEKQMALQRQRQEQQQQMREARLAKKASTEKSYREQWLAGLKAEFDLEDGPTKSFESIRKRPWLNPKNLDTRLKGILSNSQSPVQKWVGLARKMQDDDKEEQNEQKGGARLLPGFEGGTTPPGAPTFATGSDMSASLTQEELVSAFSRQRIDSAKAKPVTEEISDEDEKLLAELKQMRGEAPHSGK